LYFFAFSFFLPFLCFLQRRHDRRFLFNMTGSSADPRPGKFHVSGLHAADDFPRLAHAAVTRCEETRRRTTVLFTEVKAEIDAGRGAGGKARSTTLQYLWALDDISNSICEVIDAAELCRNVHPDPNFRQGAEQTFDILHSYMQILNTDETFYQNLRELCGCVDVMNALEEEEQRLAHLLFEEFKRDGAHLPADTRTAIIGIQEAISQLGSEFSRGIHHSKGSVTVPRQAIAGLPRNLLQTSPRTVSGDSSMVCLETESNTVNTILQFVPDGAVRRQIFMSEWETPHVHNNLTYVFLTSLFFRPSFLPLVLDILPSFLPSVSVLPSS
jgi:intermediate peptidase